MTNLREKNITLSKSKCEFNKDSLEYYRYIIANPKEIKAIKEADIPKKCIGSKIFIRYGELLRKIH